MKLHTTFYWTHSLLNWVHSVLIFITKLIPVVFLRHFHKLWQGPSFHDGIVFSQECGTPFWIVSQASFISLCVLLCESWDNKVRLKILLSIMLFLLDPWFGSSYQFSLSFSSFLCFALRLGLRHLSSAGMSEEAASETRCPELLDGLESYI